MLNSYNIIYKVSIMKRVIFIVMISGLLAACSASNSQPKPADSASLKSLEVSQKSNSERILRLEQEIDTMRKDVQSMRRQTKHLADSYDSLIVLFHEHKKLTMKIMESVKKILPPQE